jgi:protein-arginine kinase activator protein McsA
MISDEEMLMGELARLQTILMIYEDKEQYEKAAVIMDKIKRIQYKLNKI